MCKQVLGEDELNGGRAIYGVASNIACTASLTFLSRTLIVSSVANIAKRILYGWQLKICLTTAIYQTSHANTPAVKKLCEVEILRCVCKLHIVVFTKKLINLTHLDEKQCNILVVSSSLTAWCSHWLLSLKSSVANYISDRFLACALSAALRYFFFPTFSSLSPPTPNKMFYCAHLGWHE